MPKEKFNYLTEPEDYPSTRRSVRRMRLRTKSQRSLKGNKSFGGFTKAIADNIREIRSKGMSDLPTLKFNPIQIAFKKPKKVKGVL